jgi:hypothetical protein
MTLRHWLTKLFGSGTRKIARRPAVRRVRPQLEGLEDRVVCNVYTWVPLGPGSPNGNDYGNPLNWRSNDEAFNPTGHVPYEDSDIAEFGGPVAAAFGSTGAPCFVAPATWTDNDLPLPPPPPPGTPPPPPPTVTKSVFTLSRIEMDDDYTGTVTLGTAAGVGAIVTLQEFRQTSTLVLNPGSSIDSEGAFNIYGKVYGFNDGIGGASLKADGGFNINHDEDNNGAKIFAVETAAPPAGVVSLSMTGSVNLAGGTSQPSINVGAAVADAVTAAGPGSLKITGNITTDGESIINVFAGSVLTPLKANSADAFTEQGVLNLHGGGTYVPGGPVFGGATVANAGTTGEALKLDGGTLNLLDGPGAAVTGDLHNDNGGTINFPDTFAVPAGAPLPAAGAFFVGGSYWQTTDPTLSGATYGTLNLGLQFGVPDVLTVGGFATLGGNLNVIAETPLPPPGTVVYAIVVAGIGSAGNFGGAPAAMNLPPGFAEAIVGGPGPLSTVIVS